MTLDGGVEVLGEIGTRLGHCRSISSLRLQIGEPFDFDEALPPGFDSFFRLGVAKMNRLTRLEIDLDEDEVFDPLTIDAIGYAVAQLDALEHFTIFNCGGDESVSNDDWSNLGTTIDFVKSLSLDLRGGCPTSAVLRRLQSCESLKIEGDVVVDRSTLVGKILPSLPKLRTLTIANICDSAEKRYGRSLGDALLDIIMSSNCIATIVLTDFQFKETIPTPSEVNAFCLLNRGFLQTRLVSARQACGLVYFQRFVLTIQQELPFYIACCESFV